MILKYLKNNYRFNKASKKIKIIISMSNFNKLFKIWNKKSILKI